MPEPRHEIRTGEIPAAAELADLYDAVGWTGYTEDVARLRRAVAASFHVATAWSLPRRRSGASAAEQQGGARELVGLARVVSDGETIAYLQDLLVRPGHRRRGIARELVQEVLAPVRDVRQQVLLTDDEPAQRAVYESLGFTEVREVTSAGLRAFVRLNPGPG